MKYSKKHVNEVIDEIVELIINDLPDQYDFEIKLKLIREEHLLVDRRLSSTPEYASNILADFLEFRMPYKDIMGKYHCSMRTLKSLLIELSETDQRVEAEMELRRH